jgi:hypothetical protein
VIPDVETVRAEVVDTTVLAMLTVRARAAGAVGAAEAVGACVAVGVYVTVAVAAAEASTRVAEEAPQPGGSVKKKVTPAVAPVVPTLADVKVAVVGVTITPVAPGAIVGAGKVTADAFVGSALRKTVTAAGCVPVCVLHARFTPLDGAFVVNVGPVVVVVPPACRVLAQIASANIATMGPDRLNFNGYFIRFHPSLKMFSGIAAGDQFSGRY